MFLREAKIKTLSFEDVYAGKLCAALDRQRPRDLFDVHKLLQQEGISDLLWQAFLIYLSSSDRPIHEMIAPRCLDIRPEFFREFLDMSADPISISDLEQAREMLIRYVQKRLKTEGSDFLVSLLQGDPDWTLLKTVHAQKLPGIQWKLLNIKKMSLQKRDRQLQRFTEIIETA